MNGFRKALFATIIIIALPAAQASASTFDGAWNVRISSSSETCGNGSTVAIGINNGQIASSSADAGSTNVTLSTGIKRAVGFGRLSGTSGSGTWRGSMCTGTWTAERM
jgi:hypothetical protein